ncbi:MAG: ABC transporter ATP-binding protein [Treponema sp.]|nr:ABC transporter ATP-binding protein [Treponema sp.]
MSGELLLSARNLRCVFNPKRRSVEVVRGIDLTLFSGEILGIVGESGSGKTMAMRSIIQILPDNAVRTADALDFNGIDLLSQTENAMRSLCGKEIAMIFQDPMTSLNPLKRIGAHIEEVLLRHTPISRAAAAQEALTLLARAGIPAPKERARQYPHELSGGMRQRVLIAMALACRPKLLIADEPTTALDVTIQAQILALLRSLRDNEGMAVILITHDLGVVASFCHRVAVMYAGLIMEEGSVDEIFSDPLHPYTRALLRSVPSIDEREQTRLLTIEGQPPSMLEPPQGCPFAPRCAQADGACTQALPPMRPATTGYDTSEHCARCCRGKL